MRQRWKTAAIALLAAYVGLGAPVQAGIIRILNREEKTPVIGATVQGTLYDEGDAQPFHAMTDTLGQCHIPEADSALLRISHVQYETTRTKTIQGDISLRPHTPELGAIVVQGGTFQDLPEANTKHAATLNQNLEYVLTHEREFDLNDITSALLLVPTVNKKPSDQTNKVYLSGNLAPTILDGIELINDSKFEVLGRNSIYTFDRVTIREDHSMQGGFPGSIWIKSKSQPSKKRTWMYTNPIIREAYHERRIGDSAFAFVDIFHADNTILQLLTDDIQAPTYMGGESKIQYWQRDHEASLYYLFGQGDIGEGTNKSGIAATTRDHTFIGNFATQPAVLGFLHHPEFSVNLGHQDARLFLNNEDRSISLMLLRQRTDAQVQASLHFPEGTLSLYAGLQRNVVDLKGALEATDVGDGGAAFQQYLDKVSISENFLSTTLGLGWSTPNLKAFAKYTREKDKKLLSLWGEAKHSFWGVPVDIGFGHIKQSQSNMDVLDNRYVIPKRTGLPPQSTYYVTGKAVKKIGKDWHVMVGGYANWSRMNRYVEPTWEQIVHTHPDIRDTLGFIQDVIDSPEKYVPPGRFHALRGGRIGGSLAMGGKVMGNTIDAVVRYEDAYTYIPDWDALVSYPDSIIIQDYEGAKVSHRLSNGWSGQVRLRRDIDAGLGSPLEAEAMVHGESGNPYQTVGLVPLQVTDESGEVVMATYEDQPIYVKQRLLGQTARFPGSWNIDARISYRPWPNLRISVFGNNLLSKPVILEEHYRTKYHFFTTGERWHNTTGHRLAGFIVEWNP